MSAEERFQPEEVALLETPLTSRYLVMGLMPVPLTSYPKCGKGIG